MRERTEKRRFTSENVLLDIGRLGLVVFYVCLGALIQTKDALPIWTLVVGMSAGITLGIPYFIVWLRIRRQSQ